jgi:hypothetical protein
MAQPPAEVSERLLTAWRGEILAGAVYGLIARRLKPREADILRRMAEAEGGHRRRLEERMAQLGIAIPDPATVKVPVWLRLQARIAPIDRLLAAREAAEDEEVDGLYKRSTGDLETDRLLREIRKEERSHSLAVADMRSGGSDTPSFDSATAGPAADGSPAPGPVGPHPFPERVPGSTASSAARSGTPAAPAGSRARSTGPTTDWRPCSGSWPACRAPPAARARC